MYQLNMYLMTTQLLLFLKAFIFFNKHTELCTSKEEMVSAIINETVNKILRQEGNSSGV